MPQPTQPSSRPAPQARPEQQSTAHPEQQRPQPGAPGDDSSKTPHRERDARTGHDKDGNEERRQREGA